MSGRVTITTSDREWDPADFDDDGGSGALEKIHQEILTGVYIRLTVAQKKALQEASINQNESMSSIVRGLLDARENK
jgi:hypothetical protein